MSRATTNMANDEGSSSSEFSLLSRNEAESKSGLTAPFSNMNLKQKAKAQKPSPALAKRTTSKSESSSFLLVEDGKSRNDDTSSGSGSWSLVNNDTASSDSRSKKQKTDSSTASDVKSKAIQCPKCTFLNSSSSQLCGMCDAALSVNPTLGDDEQLALYLQQQEPGGENYVPEENVYPPTLPGQSQALLQQSRILANDILAAVQLCQELGTDDESPNKKGAPLVHVSPIPPDNLTNLVSRFLEYQCESQSKGKVHLCYCITHNYEAPMIQKRGFGENMRFSATAEGALASFEFGDLPKYNPAFERQQRLRNTPTYGLARARQQRLYPFCESLEDIVRRVKEQDAAGQVSPVGNIEPNTTAWLVAIPAISSVPKEGGGDNRNKKDSDFRAAVNRNGNISPAMIYYRDQSLPLVAFPAEIIYQDSIGQQLYQSLHQVCQESLAGCLPMVHTTKSPAASPTTKTTMLPSGTPSPGWSSIKRNDRALSKFR